jgi:hypothetical protein
MNADRIAGSALSFTDGMSSTYSTVMNNSGASLRHNKRALSSSEKASRRATLKSSATVDTLDDLLYSKPDAAKRENLIFTQELCILSVRDPVQGQNVTLDEAIRTGLFDIATRMYTSPLRPRQKLTLVEAIDQKLIEIKNADFHVSYDLVVDEVDRKTSRSYTRVVAIRFVVDSFTGDVVPLNVAVAKSLVRIDQSGQATLIGGDRVMTLKRAYAAGLALTVADIDDNARKLNFKVYLARKSTTGKVMSSRSALAKSWVSVEKRVYIDKMSENEEFRFSQAIDMDLLILRVEDESKVAPAEQRLKVVDGSGSRAPLVPRSKSNNVIAKTQ